MNVIPRLLCADDEDVVREALTLFVKRLGIEILCVSNGDDCIQCFREAPERYDLLVVNFDMPGKDGLQVALELRNIERGARIALTSAYPEREVFRALPPGEVFAFLRKPFTLDSLRQFLQIQLPSVEPTVFFLHGTLNEGVVDELRNEFTLEVCTERSDVVRRATRGLANVVVWSAEAGDDGDELLDLAANLQSQGIPLLTLYEPEVPASVEERFGAVAVSRNDLVAAIRAASGGRG